MKLKKKKYSIGKEYVESCRSKYAVQSDGRVSRYENDIILISLILFSIIVSLFSFSCVFQAMLEEMEQKKQTQKRRNLNPFTKQYVIQNNLNGCHKWLGKFDHKWFGEYL